MDPRLEAMVEAARAGGAVALEHYRRGFEVTLKADRSPVTEADREAERAIVGVLRGRCPDHGVLGEELGEAGPRDRRFIIDPIDGTRNFVRRIPTWAVMIGLEEEGVVTAGAVFQPVTGVLHTAWRGQGAFRDGERIRVSRVDALDRALVVHSSLNFLRRSRYWDGFLTLVDRTQVQRGFGDYSAYLWVAEGQGEIALSTTVKAWDVAAIKVIVEEAGGRLTDLDGHRGIYGSTVLASNGLLHNEAIAALHARP
jgi:histidinol-phosphatase